MEENANMYSLHPLIINFLLFIFTVYDKSGMNLDLENKAIRWNVCMTNLV